MLWMGSFLQSDHESLGQDWMRMERRRTWEREGNEAQGPEASRRGRGGARGHGPGTSAATVGERACLRSNEGALGLHSSFASRHPCLAIAASPPQP